MDDLHETYLEHAGTILGAAKVLMAEAHKLVEVHEAIQTQVESMAREANLWIARAKELEDDTTA